MLEQYNDIITVEELCEILMIVKNTAYALLSTKQIHTFWQGSRWKVTKQSVVAYITEQTGL